MKHLWLLLIILTLLPVILDIIYYFRRRRRKYVREWHLNKNLEMMNSATDTGFGFPNRQRDDLLSDPSEGVDAGETADPFEDIERQIKNLRQGYVHFDCPREMCIGKIKRILVEIFKDQHFLLTIPDKFRIEEIKLSRKMKVKLAGNDFEITSLNSESQVILSDKKTIWNWDVKPLRSGEKEIQLIVTVCLPINNTEEFYDYPIYTRLIAVQIDRLYDLKIFWGKNWDKILVIVFGSGGIWFILRLVGVIPK